MLKKKKSAGTNPTHKRNTPAQTNSESGRHKRKLARTRVRYNEQPLVRSVAKQITKNRKKKPEKMNSLQLDPLELELELEPGQLLEELGRP